VYATLLTLLLSMGTLKPMTHTLAQTDKFSFAVLGDTQARRHVMRRAVRSIKAESSLDFAVHLGDVNYCGATTLWKKSKSIVEGSGLPWYYTIGNHELYGCFLPIRVRYTHGRWGKFWLGREDTLTVTHKGGKTLIFTDSAGYLYPKDHIARIENILKTSADNPVFLFTHRPLPYHNKYKLVRFGKRNRLQQYYKSLAPSAYVGRNKRLWKVLKTYKSKIMAVFHGHYHAYRKYKLDGIQVYNSGGGGGTLQTKWDFFHYLVVDVVGDSLSVRTVRI